MPECFLLETYCNKDGTFLLKYVDKKNHPAAIIKIKNISISKILYGIPDRV